MKKISDADIISHYLFATTGTLDDGERLDCHRCGVHSEKTRTLSFAWNRIPNQATNLPHAIELCERCNGEITALKSLGR